MTFFPDDLSLVAVVANLIPLLHFHFAKVFREPGREISNGMYALVALAYLATVALFFVDFSRQPKIHYTHLIAATTVYATLLFVVLSEALLRGGAAYLTNQRGEKWVKELDYIYLGLGALGLAMSSNRLEAVDQKISVPEFIGPFVIATALIVRALKTRVEINGWNKLP